MEITLYFTVAVTEAASLRVDWLMSYNISELRPLPDLELGVCVW
jgi:hypothetical protein